MKHPAQNHKSKIETKKSKRLAITKWIIPLVTAFLVLIAGMITLFLKKTPVSTKSSTPSTTTEILNPQNISLPKADIKSNVSVESAMNTRRSRREFLPQPLTLKQVSQMLWAAQGLTSDWGGRTVPSAKSTYPLGVYLIANKVDGLEAGEYQYIPGDRTPVHALKPIKKVDLQKAIYEQLNQNSFKNAPAIIVITGNMEKMKEAMGGVQSDVAVYLEAGHAGQNLYLQSESLKLGMVVVASFNETRMRELITIPQSETMIYMVPFGLPKL